MFRQAIRLNPNFCDAHNNLGIDLADRNELDDAIYQFQQAIQARPDYDEPYRNLGLATTSRVRLGKPGRCSRWP